ncbi:MAG: hypothetical protein WCF30_16830 [Terracidiphilus sp.]
MADEEETVFCGADRGGVDQREILRNLVVEHALTAAFGNMRRKNRNIIITTLLNLRDDPPFKQLREYLNREHLVFIEPGPEREKNARRAQQEIKRLIGSDFNQPDTVRMADGSTLRTLRRVRSVDYEKELYRVFRDLDRDVN